jgi:hypothetical protein
MEYAQHDVPTHDNDEVYREGFMAGIFAKNPYQRGTAEYRDWARGHSLINKRAPKKKWPFYWLRRMFKLF